ncbi:Imm42 family immunity protein [Acinetobacter sp. MD2]|uniref:Imm42 family immunity protein n=1 Tax=Acinetobacter sp. MD2 TaxID=2600066 RepID=UPI002D1E9FCE|nr:Imm42 family immunity protein [Acinetobacter sp. MD2]MEB3766678.1 hypothetical protein [Acinetobacter sp. MD2]
MIIKHNENFFIQWDIIYRLENNLNLGVFNFWINDTCYPAQGINITLNSLFHILVCNIKTINGLDRDLGGALIGEIDFSDFERKDLVWLDTGELLQFGFGLVLGFYNHQERL